MWYQERNWIKEKEAAANEAVAEYDAGSFGSVVYNEILTRITIERCVQLVEY